MSDRKLISETEEYRTDKGDLHSYIEIYEQILRPLQDEPVRLLEIGVLKGASLRMWRKYFPGGFIYGLDCNPTDQPNCFQMSQVDREKIASIDGVFNIIIDDGSHAIDHQLLSLCYFWPKLARGGFYFIEDVQDIAYAQYFAPFHPVVFDRRSFKGRYDDILIMLQKW